MSHNVVFGEIISVIEKKYPPTLAESWDQVGIHFGQASHPVRRILVALDVRPAVIEEAVALGCDSLIVHHPPIFSPIERFDTADPQIQMYIDLIKRDLNVYAMHTNYDIAREGMNDQLAQQLQLREISDLIISDDDRPSLGRIGRLERPLNRAELLQHVKRYLDLEHLIVIERAAQASYQTIAIIGGSGSSLLPAVIDSGADVFITGDITYHKGHDCYETDLMTIDAGHYIEQIFIEHMTQQLANWQAEYDWPLDVIASRVNTNPFSFE